MSLVNVKFYTKSSHAWEAMLEDIRNAKHTIIMEQYIFTVDSVGNQFIELFRQKAKDGVKIRLLADSAGSFAFSRSLLPDQLREQGINVRFFNPISPWRVANFTSNFFRDHRKVLIIDNEIAHLGGVGIQDYMATWRDTHMRITGPLVEQIAQSVEDVWDGWKMGFYVRYKKIQNFVRKYDLHTNSPSIRQRYLYHALLFNIRNAKKYIYLTTPYFIPDVVLYHALQLAAKRGIDVRLLVPTVADHLFINHARESYFTLALKAGIKIYTYNPTMMHAKTAVMDDAWATAGSFNLDSLSLFFNHEANISSFEPEFIQEIKNHFFEDLNVSTEVKYEVWTKRPLRKKFLELLTWPFHGLL
jgi:cardiolipin synthase